MQYRYALPVSFTLVITLLFSCGSSKHSKSAAVLPGTWQAQPVVIDGDSKDWPSPYPNYDSKGMVAYATSNDKENLYITMETGDELTQIKILKLGMNVYIDTTGHKEGQLHINYPLPNDNEPFDITKDASGLKHENAAHPAGQWDKKINKAAQDANQYALDGFYDCNGGYVVTQTTSCGIKIRLRIDEYKELVWEAAIPFKAIYGKNTITAADAGKPISVCFAIKGVKNPDTKTHDNPTGGAGTSGGGGGGGMNNAGGVGMNSGHSGRGGGGNRGAGRGGTSNDPLQHLYESTKTWKQFGLVYQQ
jgi:hypothetical protein